MWLPYSASTSTSSGGRQDREVSEQSFVLVSHLELSQALHRALGSHSGEQQWLHLTTLCVGSAKKWG